MTVEQTILEINEIYLLQKEAIYNHPQPLIDVYKKHKGIDFHSEIIASYGQEVVKSVQNYLDTSSFISAWYHLSGNKQKRDQASQSCVTLISSLGLDGSKMMITYIDNERFWRKQIKASGVAPINYKKIIWLAILTITIVVLILR